MDCIRSTFMDKGATMFSTDQFVLKSGMKKLPMDAVLFELFPDELEVTLTIELKLKGGGLVRKRQTKEQKLIALKLKTKNFIDIKVDNSLGGLAGFDASRVPDVIFQRVN